VRSTKARRRLIVGGGDGSVHDVVNGIMGAGLPADDRVTIAQAPLGTGNDWAHGLGLPRARDGIADLILGARSRPHDVGTLDFAQPASGAVAKRWFVNVAGAGFDASSRRASAGPQALEARYISPARCAVSIAYESADYFHRVSRHRAVAASAAARRFPRDRCLTAAAACASRRRPRAKMACSTSSPSAIQA
jgi:hypothetical protein